MKSGEMLVTFCFKLIMFVIHFLQISISSNQLHNGNCKCHLDFFNSATKLDPKKDNLFDTSRLNKTGWFEIPLKYNGNLYKFYFSFCQPNDTTNPPSPCSDKDSLTCVTKNEKNHWIEIIPNAGTHFSGFTFEDNQLQVSLQRGDGTLCKTVFKISCSYVERTPVVSTEDLCSFFVFWEHPVACPLQESKLQNSCIFQHSGEKFDLRPLRHKTFIKVKNFEVNVCGYINEGKCKETNVTVCEVVGNTGIARAMGDNINILYTSTEKKLKLQYLNKNGVVQAEIHFFCSSNKKVKHKGNYTFIMHTSLVCPEGHCSNVINKKGYNLDILRNEYKNYEIDEKGMKYVFNFCGPLVRKQQSVWNQCDGLICLWDPFTNITLNIGTQVLPLVEERIDGNDVISYQIIGGDYCHLGGTNQAKFTLMCYKKDMSPQFEKQEFCTHFFRWKTPAACKYTNLEETSSCHLEGPLHSYDLSPIRNAVKDYKVIEKSETFEMNICGPMTKNCGTTSGSGVCWTHEGSKAIAIGYYRYQDLVYSKDQIFLLMEGDSCQVSRPNTSHVVITFTCEMDLSKTSQPYLLTMDIERCFFHFVWPSPYVCQTITFGNCKIIDQRRNYTYDLNPLRRSNRNYKINYNSDSDDAVILLNVCTNLVFEPDINPKLDVGVSLYNLSENSEFRRISLGCVGEEYIRFKDDMLRMDFMNGDICYTGSSRNSYVASVHFICNPQLQESKPRLIEVYDCKFRFIWETNAACPLLENQKLGFKRMENEHLTCTVQNPVTNFRIDLRLLMDNDYVIKTKGGLDFHLGVCRSLSSKNFCKNRITGKLNKTGSCLDGKSHGVANSLLQYRKGAVFLNYSNGDNCDGRRKYSTIINFICNPNEPSTGPVHEDSKDSCISFIHWETSLVCERKVRCVAASKTKNFVLNLSPLISNTVNYQVKIGNSTVFINVCRPLVVVPGLKCSPGSSVCHTDQQTSTTVIEKSLGYLSTPPVIAADQTVWLRYDRGDRCATDPNKFYSTAIQFMCHPYIGVGQPVLKEINSCEYTFGWNTSYACVDKKNYFDSAGCAVYDYKDQLIMNLTILNHKHAITISSIRGTLYKLQLCDTSGSSQYFLSRQIGNIWSFVGKPEDVLFRYTDNSTLIKITNGTECVNQEPFKAEVNLKCDPQHAADTSKPFVVFESSCSVAIEWSSSYLCYHKITSSASPAAVEVASPVYRKTSTASPAFSKVLQVPHTTQTNVPEAAAGTALPSSEQESNITFILGILVVVAVVIVTFIVAVKYIRKKYNLTDSTELFAMENLSSPSCSTVYYSRVRFKSEEKAKLI